MYVGWPTLESLEINSNEWILLARNNKVTIVLVLVTEYTVNACSSTAFLTERLLHYTKIYVASSFWCSSIESLPILPFCQGQFTTIF
mgnify:CR=1 FL=1